MSPGGHLLTTALTCAAVQVTTGSVALAAGVLAGGFLIDVDHVVDYLTFDRRRDLRPAAFLRYYSEQRLQRAVLLLHSYELLAALIALSWAMNSTWLWGYSLGMALHLPLDVLFNGRALSKNLVPFYSFAYRWHAGFRAEPLLGVTAPRPVPGGFWRCFFAELFPRPAAEPAPVARPARSGPRPAPAHSVPAA